MPKAGDPDRDNQQEISSHMKQCPICFHDLEVRDCNACDDCGGTGSMLTELQLLDERKNVYTIYEVYKGLRLMLCHFCSIDFGSYRPEYFGFENDQRISISEFNFIKEVENPPIVKDKFCPECNKRLKFLNFVAAIRKINQNI